MIKSAAVTAAYALLGWSLCALTMDLAMRLTTRDAAIIFHDLAVPFIYTGTSLLSFRHACAWSPVRAAAAFVAVVALMDIVVVGLLIEHSFAMFRSVIAIWLPFTLVFLCTWWTGRAVRRAGAAKHVNMGV